MTAWENPGGKTRTRVGQYSLKWQHWTILGNKFTFRIIVLFLFFFSWSTWKLYTLLCCQIPNTFISYFDILFAAERRLKCTLWNHNYIYVKGVKKVCSAIPHWIWKVAKQNIAEYFSLSIHRWSTVILYTICNYFWHWMNSQRYVFLGYGLGICISVCHSMHKVWAKS